MEYLIPHALLNDLVQIASQAPAPYAKTQAMWAALARLQPQAEREEKAKLGE